MSLYCKGDNCQRKDECLRFEAWESFQDKNIQTGCSTGLWLVFEPFCISQNYKDGVFEK